MKTTPDLLEQALHFIEKYFNGNKRLIIILIEDK